jgi:transposase
MDVSALLPADYALRVQDLAIASEIVAIVATGTASTAVCPECNAPSEHVHARAIRTVADVPWQGRRVVLRLVVRRFQCRNGACARRTFTERLPVVAPYAQTTIRLTAVHQAIGFALGGESGARLAGKLAVPTSPDTLLRRVRQAALGTIPSPRVLGIDDFAFRKGQTYGTILVDLERRRVVDLLPNREVDTIAAWLRAHRGAEVITRDRATAYAQAAREAAPEAVQVADRWHLLKNVRDALERVLHRRTSAIRSLFSSPKPVPSARPAQDEAKGRPSAGAPEESQRRREDRFERVRRLHEEGYSLRRIAAELSLHYRTVERYVRSEACPDWDRGHRRPSALDRFEEYIRRRLSEGCRNRRQLRGELVLMGCRVGRTSVEDYIRRLEADRGVASSPALPRDSEPQIQVPSARKLAVLSLIRPEDRTAEDRQHLSALCSGDRAIGEAMDLAAGFAAMIRNRVPDSLAAWLSRAECCSVAGMRSFARGLRQDEAAVRAAMTVEWSNGQVEGRVNRLKLVKRSMFGRARFDLLRARVLHAA